MRGCFVTGTDTGVGKSVLSGCLVASLRARGVQVGALKPVITGLDEPVDPDWPPDHRLLAACAGMGAREVTAISFGPPVSPHLAAELAGHPIVRSELLAAAQRAGERFETLIVEGVGGLLVPLADDYDVRAFAVDLGLPLVIAARPGLGTINHTLLTLGAARAVGLVIAAVVLTPWPEQPTEMERSNRATIARLGDVPVATLGPLARAEPALLAAAGATLPVEDWLGSARRPVSV